jgi:hypothetical protein
MVELHRNPSLFEITGFPPSGNDVNKQFWFFFDLINYDDPQLPYI